MKLRTWCIRIGQILTKTVLVFTGFLVFLTLFNPAATKAENDRGGITIRHQNAPIEKVFQSIEKQSGYRFFYNETLLQGAGKVTMNLQNVSLQEALDACFHNQPLSYAIVDKTIIVKKRPEQQPKAPEVAVTFSKPGKIIAVRGKVTSGNAPVVGASIMIKGTENGASTDKDGMFALPEVEDDATLVVSSVSHTAREIRLNGQTFIAIDLSQRSDDLDEAVVVAYNTTTKRMNTGSVTVVKGSEIQNLPNRSFEKSLQGLVPGLQITQGTGQPGGGVSNFVLRGIATGGVPNNSSTVRNPLIIVDGVPVLQEPVQINFGDVAYNNPLAQLNPSDIESISVLKDAAAIALYGSKASNGVILVTTKKGKQGKTIFNFRHQSDISERLGGKSKLLNQDEYLSLVYETFKNTDPVFWTDFRIDSLLKKKFPVDQNGNFYPASDWVNELYLSNAFTFSNDLSMSGGNEKQSFYLNLEYTKQNGIEKKTGFDRKSIRFNYENRPASWLKIGMNTTLSYNVQKYGSGGTTELTASRISPLNPIRGADGDYIYHYNWGIASSTNLTTNGAFYKNPAVEQLLNINKNTSYRGLSKLYADVNLFKNFNFTSSVGVDFMLTETKEKIHPKLSIGGAPGVGQLSERSTRSANIINTNIVRYNRLLAQDHRLNVLLGQEAQILTNNYVGVVKQNISANPVTDQINGGTLTGGGGLSSKQTLLSYFGQTDYSFKDRYFISASIRRDGSSLFGENNRFGTYWSSGIGWEVSSEPFIQNIKRGWLNYLKIRSSIGSSGNSSAILNTLRYDQIVLTSFLNGNAVYPYTSPGNPGIQWERTATWDAGLDMKLFRNRISITADVYSRKTFELIGNIEIPGTSGYSTLRDNIGTLKNDGIELSVLANIINGKNFRWSLNATWSTNRNRLTKSFYPLETAFGSTTVTTSSVYVNGEGKNYNSFYLAQWAGVDPANGKPLWIDSAGKPTSNYLSAKPEFVGKPQPDGFGSIITNWSWKNLELSVMFYYQYGLQIYQNPSSNPLVNDGLDPFINQDKASLNRWQKPGDVAINPRRLLFGKDVIGSSDGGSNNSTRFLLDGDFIRLSNASISYSLSKKTLDKLHLSACKLFVQGHNLAIITKYSGRQDPENIGPIGAPNNLYPLQRSYSVGVNLNF